MVEVSPLIGRTSRISASAFTGRAVAPAQLDPETTGLISRNSLQLAAVSNQIQGMSAQMNSLAGSLQVIASNLGTAQALERQKEIQEQTLESRLAEQKLREGKESVIEKKIQTAAIAPAQKLASTAQFTLGRLGQFFTSLLGGWLLIKGVETLKALSEGNSERLNEIKNNVLGTLGLITGIFVAYKGGLALLTAAFSRMGGRLVAVAAAGLFVKPFNDFITFIVDAAKDAIRQIPGLGGLVPDNEPEVDPSQPPSGEQLAEQEQSGGQNLEGKGGPTLSTPTETMMGEKVDPKLQELQSELGGVKQDYMLNRIGKEEYEQEKKRLTSEIEGLKSGNNEAQVTAKPQETMLGKPVEETEGEKGAELDPSKPAQYGETSLKPEESTEEQGKEGNVPIEGDLSKGLETSKLFSGEKSFLEMGFTVGEVESFVDTEKYIGKLGKLPADMFTPVKKDKNLAEKVGPAPEPPVNVVPIPTGGESSAAAAPAPEPVSSGGINNAPSYPTSNRDNIYILGAMSNFNVVMV